MYRDLRLLALFLLATFTLQAQQLSLFTQYREHSGIINPAALAPDYLAFGQRFSVSASYRAQWAGIANGPTTQTLNFSGFVDDFGSVSPLFGAFLINDQTGPTGFTGLYGRFAGVLSADPEYYGFAIGASIGAVQYRVNASEINLRQANDVVGMMNQSQINMDVGVGLYYYNTIGSGNYLYSGISVPQTFGLNLAFETPDGTFSIQRIQHFYGIVGFYAFFDNDSFLHPSAWIKYVANSRPNIDFNLQYQLPSNLWIGAGVSSNPGFHFEAGLLLGGNSGFDNTMKFGYGFDYSFSSFGPYVGSAHELILSISFD